MSSFPASRTLQLPLISAIRPARLWTQDCVLCLEAAGERLVCPACEAGLAAIGRPCPGCALPLPPGGTCAPCRRHPHAFDAAVARFEYRFPVDRLVQRFKYAGDLALGRWLALQLAEHVRGLPRPDLLVAPAARSPAPARARLQPGRRAGAHAGPRAGRAPGHHRPAPRALHGARRRASAGAPARRTCAAHSSAAVPTRACTWRSSMT